MAFVAAETRQEERTGIPHLPVLSMWRDSRVAPVPVIELFALPFAMSVSFAVGFLLE